MLHVLPDMPLLTSAVFVSTKAACIFDGIETDSNLQEDIATKTPLIWRHIQAGTCIWRPGLRLGSQICGGKAGKQMTGGKTAVYYGDESWLKPPNKLPDCPSASKFRYCELFAGIGGFRIALDALGGECVFASEIDSSAAGI